eukprot:1350313-Alexandrium_andersonii.AAC.1
MDLAAMVARPPREPLAACGLKLHLGKGRPGQPPPLRALKPTATMGSEPGGGQAPRTALSDPNSRVN